MQGALVHRAQRAHVRRVGGRLGRRERWNTRRRSSAVRARPGAAAHVAEPAAVVAPAAAAAAPGGSDADRGAPQPVAHGSGVSPSNATVAITPHARGLVSRIRRRLRCATGMACAPRVFAPRPAAHRSAHRVTGAQAGRRAPTSEPRCQVRCPGHRGSLAALRSRSAVLASAAVENRACVGRAELQGAMSVDDTNSPRAKEHNRQGHHGLEHPELLLAMTVEGEEHPGLV